MKGKTVSRKCEAWLLEQNVSGAEGPNSNRTPFDGINEDPA